MDENIEVFVDYCQNHISGDEKGEAQIFLDRFFVALGYKEGIKGAGADLEFRIRDEKKKSTSFADLFWPRRVLIEMKKSGEDLNKHLQQVTSYWLKLAGQRPQYVILCNFDELWIYDFEKDVSEPADILNLIDLPKRVASISFLLPKPQTPVFGTNREKATKNVAYLIAGVFRSLINRVVKREHAIKYCMQCILTMFAEDVDLLHNNIFSRIIKECLDYAKDNSLGGPDKCDISFDLIGNLFREMNQQGITEGGRYKGVDYFNGGLFQDIIPIELTAYEIDLLDNACEKDWSVVNPAIFGSIFEQGMDKGEQHTYGAHYTYEIDIKKIVDPVIVQPWKKKIEIAHDSDEPLEEYYKLITELRNFKVLDPACGSGNFLFVAYREIKVLEKELLGLIRENSTKREHATRLQKFLLSDKYVSPKQFYGLDKNSFAVELAKMTLMIAKELWATQFGEIFDKEHALPLENLDANIIAVDALLNDDGTEREWPIVDAIIGNPPYQSKNKMQKEFGREYLNTLWNAYPYINKYADYCVYWFNKAHKHLKEGAYAGLVGTNTIRQSNSRQSGLDFIIQNGGTIIDAVSSEEWQGEAVVHVSIVSWRKGNYDEIKHLYFYENDNLLVYKLKNINSSLSRNIDLSETRKLKVNIDIKGCFQGQTHGNEGFLVPNKMAKELIEKNHNNSKVLFPFLTGDELLGNKYSQPKRHVIDFSLLDINEAATYKSIFGIIKDKVFPDRQKSAEEQEEENKKVLEKDPNAKVNKHHINFYNNWWKLSYSKGDLIEKLSTLTRYIACSRVSSRPIFEFVSSDIRPNDALMCFTFEDDYSFGIINSSLHWEWWKEKCSTLKSDYRYTTKTVWDTFPWPQNPDVKRIKKIANYSRELRNYRNELIQKHSITLRDIYRQLEIPGNNPLKDIQLKLDKTVMEAFEFDLNQNLLTQLYNLNLHVSEEETKGNFVQSPGIPICIKDISELISDDCIKYIENK